MAPEQPPGHQVSDGGLYRTLGDTGGIREHGVAHRHEGAPGAMGEAIELKVHQKRGGRMAVRHQVSHQAFVYVRINSHRYSSCYYSIHPRKSNQAGCFRPAEAEILQV